MADDDEGGDDVVIIINLRRVEDKLDRQAALTAPTDRTRR